MAVDFDEAYLVGGWLASALWGAFTALFGTSIYLMFTKRRQDLFKPTTYIMIAMYALATAHVFLALTRIIIALIRLRNTPPGPIAYLSNIGVPLNRAKDLIYITNLVLGDSVVVWRCYAVWGGNWAVVTLPVVMVIATAVSGYGAIHQYFLSHPSLRISTRWGLSMFAVSLATNLLVTSLTAGRIWYLARKQAKLIGHSNRTFQRVILLIIESGAVIAIAKIIEFALFEASPGVSGGHSNDHPLYIIFEMMPQITGLMPTLIIFVVNAGLTSDNGQSGRVETTTTAPRRSKIAFRARKSNLPSDFDASLEHEYDRQTALVNDPSSQGSIYDDRTAFSRSDVRSAQAGKEDGRYDIPGAV